MRSVSELKFHRYVVIAGFLAFALTATAQTQSRIIRPMDNGERTAVSGAHPMARSEFDRGPTAGSMKIDRAAIVFKLSPAQQSALDKLLAEQQDPKTPNYHRWLTPEQYAERFGMSEEDLAKVSAWLKSQGLTVDGYSRARTELFFSGAAAQVARAFQTEFRNYQADDEIRFANARRISVPAALSGVVLGFRGFDSFRPRPRARAVKPNFTSHVTGTHFLAPGDFATIYNIPSGFDGTGQTIAIAGQTDINFSDIDAFRSAEGLPARTASNFQKILIPSGGSGFKDADEVEADLDLEWSNGVAKNATILYVYAGANSTTKNVFDALQFAIDQNVAPVVGTSYGNCEANLKGFVQTLQQVAQQANSQGQTITAASGDAGAADCELATAKSATHGLAVDSPASLPEVTGIGGSEFTGDAAGTVTGTAPNTDATATKFWAGTSGAADSISSALSYIPEMAWNDTAAGGGLSATGGGASTVFSKPSWQTSAGVPADGSRDVPDVSLSASPNHDPYLICSQSFFAGKTPAVTSCSSGFRASDGNLAAVGGTSVGAPAFAGIVAILNQAKGSAGLGNINPALYSLAASAPNSFHDITTGDNKVPCGSGSTNCPAGTTSIGFSAGTGYDLVTGLGSVDAGALISSFQAFTPNPDFSLFGYSATVSSPGQQATSKIVLESAAGFTDNVSLTCAPTSTTANITCTISPSSVMVTSSGGTSTMTINTQAAHVVSGASASLQRPRGFGWLAASGSALLAGIFLLGVPPRRRHRILGFGLMLLIFFAAGLGCGGSSSSGHTAGTPAGSYTIAVTATSTTPPLSHTANVAVTVQ
jgi:subtilase family serine protease